MVFNGGDFKNGISFSFRIPPHPPKGASKGGEAGRGAETYTPQKIMKHINSGVPNSGISKIRSVFLLGYIQDPNKGVTRELWGGG